MNLIFISYSFPPLLLPEAIQASYAASTLAERGWKIFAIAGNSRFSSDYIDKELNNLLDKRINISRPFSAESRFVSGILRRVLPVALNFPDNKATWLLPAYFKAKQILKANKIDLIYSRSCPFTSHLVGLRLKKEFGIPWVAHFSDPWVDSPFQSTFGERHRTYLQVLESSVMQVADAAIFVSEEARNLVMKKYPELISKKSHCLPHCFPSIGIAAPGQPLKCNGKFMLTFTGNLFGPRQPLPLFMALKVLKQRRPDIGKELVVRMVGTMERRFISQIKELGISDLLLLTGMVSYAKSIELIRGSDALILIDGDFAGKNVFFPAKLMDYAASRKPIIGITPIDSVSSRLLSELGQPVVGPSDIKRIADTIESFMKAKGQSMDGKRIKESGLLSYRAENVIPKLEKIFKRIVEEKQ